MDTVVFLDAGYGTFINLLKDAKFNVWGAPAEVEQLELNRIYMREKMKELGIETPDAEIVVGTTNVVKYLEKHEGTHFIKLNKYRGNRETFSASSPEEARLLLESARFGAMEDDIKFIIEDGCEGIEIGADAWFNGKNFLKTHFFTIENKGAGNMGIYTHSSVLDEVFQKLTPYLAANKYTGSFCFEGFYDGKTFKMIDITPRFPYPCSASWIMAIKNYDKFIRGVAAGTIEDVELNLPYHVQFNVLASEPTTWRKIELDEDKLDGITQFIGFKKIIKREDGYYFVPSDEMLGTVCGAGKSFEECLKNALEASEKIHSWNISVATASVMFFKEKIKELDKYNIKVLPAGQMDSAMGYLITDIQKNLNK